jgi:hypothetical protein
MCCSFAQRDRSCEQNAHREVKHVFCTEHTLSACARHFEVIKYEAAWGLSVRLSVCVRACVRCGQKGVGSGYRW